MSDHSDDEPSFPDPPRLARDAAEVVPVAPDGSLEEHVFSAAAPGAELHFQVVRLRDQIYAWVGVGAAGEKPPHGEMSMALKTRMSDAPSVTTLTRAVEGGGASGAPGPGAEGLVPSSRRIRRRVRRRGGWPSARARASSRPSTYPRSTSICSPSRRGRSRRG